MQDFERIRRYPDRLRAAAEQTKDRLFSFGEPRTDSLALDCANAIEDLLAAYDQLQARCRAAEADKAQWARTAAGYAEALHQYEDDNDQIGRLILENIERARAAQGGLQQEGVDNRD